MGTRTLAIFSVSAGTGHIRAAEALKAAAELTEPRLRVIHIDLMSLVPRWFRKVYAESYYPLVERHPSLWGYLYEQSDKRKLDSRVDRLRIAIERLNLNRLKETVHELNPDIILCTHFLPAELFSRWRRKRTLLKPVWVVVTDFDIHMLWVHRHLSGYCVASSEVAWRLRDRGVAAEQIHVTGIPIMPSFSQKLSRSLCAREVGIDPSKRTLLLMSGGGGVQNIRDLAMRLVCMPSPMQIIALAGKNRRLLEEFRALGQQYPGRLFPIGYTNTIERLMAASDVAVTKSGGLTSSECLAMGLPMIVVSPIPGQEERNADYLLENGSALKAYDESGLEFRVKELLTDKERLRGMRAAAKRLARPRAAWDILNIALDAE